MRSGSLCSNIQLDVVWSIWELEVLLLFWFERTHFAQCSKGEGIAACNDNAASENVTERRWDEVLPKHLPDGDIRPRKEAKGDHVHIRWDVFEADGHET